MLSFDGGSKASSPPNVGIPSYFTGGSLPATHRRCVATASCSAACTRSTLRLWKSAALRALAAFASEAPAPRHVVSAFAVALLPGCRKKARPPACAASSANSVTRKVAWRRRKVV